MKVLGRRPHDIAKAIADPRRYRTFWRMYQRYPDFWSNLHRFLTAGGTYPFRCRVRTPLGVVAPTLYSSHDLFTMNEAFCRVDYPADENTRVVVDLGANIGLTALYFLTRSSDSFCYLFEPNPANVEKLKKNLRGLERRFQLTEAAVADFCGTAEFGVEPTGRYGGIGVQSDTTISVQCLHINDVLKSVVDRHGTIDILKIDTEGAELATLRALHPDYQRRIEKIYFEGEAADGVVPHFFRQRQYWTVCHLFSREKHDAA